MLESICRLTGILLFISCFGSFGWAMRRFFLKPSGAVAGMTLIKVAGTIFALLHLYCLLQAPVLHFGAQQVCVGVVIYTLSLALFWWALETNRRKPLSAVFSPDAPVHLVQQGPYQFIRHPFYSSYLLSWIAGAFVTGRLWLLVTAVVMLILYYRAAKYEENKFASSALGSSYRSYRSRTGLFLPNPIKILHRSKAMDHTP